jgi:hypothetical protein
VEAVPTTLKHLIVGNESTDDTPQERRANFESGVVYDVDPEGGILTKAGRRQARSLQAQAAQQDWAEEQAIAANELPPETLAALQDSHDRYIGTQLREAEIRSRRHDEAVAAAQEEFAAKTLEFYVKRGSVMRPAAKVALKPAENVFAKHRS